MIDKFVKMGKELEAKYTSKNNVINDWLVDRVTELLNEGTKVESFIVQHGVERGRTVHNETDKKIVSEDYSTIGEILHERSHHFNNNTDWWQFNEFVDELIHGEFADEFGDNLEELMDESSTLFETVANVESEYLEMDLDSFISDNSIVYKAE